MNILAVNWQDLSNPLAGGAEIHLEEILKRIVRKGHQVTLFCSGYKNALPEEVINGIKIIRYGNRYNFNLIAPLRLRKIVRAEKYDVLVEDINKIPFYSPLYLKIPTLVVVPHLFSTTVFKEINFLLGLYIYLFEMPLVRVYRKKKFNVISESTRDDIIKRGVLRENISVIHCGIDRKTYSNDPKIKKFSQPTILYLGRIKKYKSVDHLILAFKKVLEKIPEAELYIVGSGDYLETLKSLVADNNIVDKVHFTGYVSSEKKVELMRRCHVAVYPSLKEGWGLTNIEANACGTSAVAANVPGLKDSIVHDKTGYLYEYGNIDELAEKLKEILLDTETRLRLEKGGLDWAESFNWDNAAEEFIEELNEVVSQR